MMAAMRTDELRANSYALIGMLCLRGPSTAYELKKAMGHIGREFWAVSHTQHYQETARLEQLGMVTSSQEPDGRHRRVYAATGKGRAALREWLDAPTMVSIELRDVALLKLFLADLGDRGAIIQLARGQMDLYRERLAALDRIDQRFADQPGHEMPMTVVPFGRALYSAALQFWTGIATGTPSPATVTAQTPETERGDPSGHGDVPTRRRS
jgi:PadR family transcriptional regulator, regulatory protein AphA